MTASRLLNVRTAPQALHCESCRGKLAEHMGHCHEETTSAIAGLLEGRGEVWRSSVRNPILMVRREDSCPTRIHGYREHQEGEPGSALAACGRRLGRNLPRFPFPQA